MAAVDIDARAVVRELRAKGKSSTASTYVKHGVKDEALGVNNGDIKAIVKRIGVNQQLALDLWSTGIHEARVVATKVADPLRMTRRQIETWLHDVRDYVLDDALSSLAARLPNAPELARAWIASSNEWMGAAGWNIVSLLARGGGVSNEEARSYIERIRGGIHRAENRARHSMNSALISIGGSLPGVRELAVTAARAIGTVKVNHGDTGCKTPDAVEYIGRMAEHGEVPSLEGTPQPPPGSKRSSSTAWTAGASESKPAAARTAAGRAAARTTATRRPAAAPRARTAATRTGTSPARASKRK